MYILSISVYWLPTLYLSITNFIKGLYFKSVVLLRVLDGVLWWFQLPNLQKLQMVRTRRYTACTQVWVSP